MGSFYPSDIWGGFFKIDKKVTERGLVETYLTNFFVHLLCKKPGGRWGGHPKTYFDLQGGGGGVSEGPKIAYIINGQPLMAMPVYRRTMKQSRKRGISLSDTLKIAPN